MKKILESHHCIPVKQGQIELMASQTEHKKTTAIMCHPHSQMGGTMNNKVVTTVIQAWQTLHYNTLRFNFRGVAQSSGSFDQGEGEQHDLADVIAWAKQHFQAEKLVIGGFSFGAFVALKYCQQTVPDGLVLLAPPTHYPDFYTLHTPKSSKNLLIVAEADEVVSSIDILKWAETEYFEQILTIPDASHFFHGKLILLRNFIEQYGTV